MSIHLYSRSSGAGEPLLLLHGNGEDGTYFKNQIRYFSKSYQVIAVDTRGHGKSPRGKAPFRIRQFAEDLRAFMDEKGIQKAHILGFSDGGNIALIFAVKYPERVNRLIINGANLNPKGVKPAVQIPIEIGYRFASCFGRKDSGARRHAELLGLMVKDPDIPASELKKITAKTLVIAGTKDMIREEHTRLIYESLPDGELVLIPGDHFIAEKNPQAFNWAVEKFLQEREG